LARLRLLPIDPRDYGRRLPLRRPQQRFDCLAQLRVAGAALAQEFVPLARAQL